MGKKETALQKAGRNSKYIWAIIVLIFGILAGMYKITIYINDTSDLPNKLKTVEKTSEKNSDKISNLSPRLTSLETRMSTVEMLVATISAENKQAYQQIQSDLNIIKSQITRAGLEHK